MNFYKGIEQSIATVSDTAYQQLEFYYGKELELFRSSTSANDPFKTIHAGDALSNLKKLKNFIGITQSDDFSTSDSFNAANFQEGFLVTQDTEIKSGDVVVFSSEGGTVRWKVEERVDIGYTTNMYIKYSLSNLN